MKQTLLFFLILSFSGASFLSEKKFTGTISHQYLSWEDPVQIEYTIHPYGGSGNYQYRWRKKGSKFSEYSSDKKFYQQFECEKAKRPEISVFVQILDLDSDKKIMVETTHPVEICTNLN